MDYESLQTPPLTTVSFCTTPTYYLLGLALGVVSLLGEAYAATSAQSSLIIEQMSALESRNDPKCYATASRLEDFMFGTPLTFEARAEKNQLQRRLIADVWLSASSASGDGEAESLSSADIIDAASKILTWNEESSGHWKVSFSKSSAIYIHKDDLRQYSSVAYSLRALLGAQQKIMLGGGNPYKPLSAEAINSLTTLSDLYTLSVLKIADSISRERNAREIPPELLVSIWYVAQGSDLDAEMTAPVVLPSQADRDLMFDYVAEKIRAYAEFNQISNALFIRNLQVYFARKRWPESSAEAQAFREKYTAGLVAWTRNLYDSVQNYVLSEGRNLIGERDVQAFLKNEMPTRANPYEDIIFFPDLGRDQQITIESYDIDAFRDSGVHWRYLEFAFKDLGPKVLLPADPFALELISEAIANAGVLMFRLAGERGERAERLAEADLDYAFTKMIELRDISNAGIPKAKSSLQPEIVSAEVAPPSTALFRDITESSGIRAHHRSSDWLSRQIRSYLQKDESTGVITLPPAFGGAGVAAGDFDSDGDADLLILSGLGNLLYRNNRDGSFTDITDQSGINWKGSDGLPGEPRQPLVADLDNDGDQDVIITYVNDPHRVFRNDGNGRFEDVSDQASLGGAGLVAGPATLLDIDNDGLLDLYVTYFGNYLEGVLPTLARINNNGSPNRLFKNEGGFKFKEITDRSGVDDTGWGQTAGHADFDGDGRQDLFAGNDFGVNRYLRNNGDNTFTDVGPELGLNKPSYTMGMALTDLNDDGHVDVYISNIVTMNKDQSYVLPDAGTPMVLDPDKLANQRVVEANDLFVSGRSGSGVQYSLSDAVGRGYSSTGWSWGALFFDADLDGDEDLYVLNGMNEYLVYSDENPYYADPAGQYREVKIPTHFTERNVFFLNQNGALQNFSENSGLDFNGNSRSLVSFDMDLDGDLDVVTLDYHGPARVFENTASTLFPSAKTLTVTLKGSPENGVNNDAVGAVAILDTTDGNKMWRQISGSDGYMSVPPKTLHYSWRNAKPQWLRVLWPNGVHQSIEVPVDASALVVEYGSGH